MSGAANQTPDPATDERPMTVALEGVLLRSDVVWEAWFSLLRRHAFRALYALTLLFRGRRFPEYLCGKVDIEPQTLPYDESLLHLLREMRTCGSTLLLVTKLPRPWAESIARHVGVFAAVIAPDQVAREAVRVDNSALPRRAAWRTWLKQIRLHQWLKNLLVFVPLLASHRFGERDLVLSAVTAFVAFGCVASGNYVLNDLLDLQHDRHHPSKRRRPLPAGLLSVPAALVGMVVLYCAGGLIASLLPLGFAEVLALYVAGTLAYSLRLKRSAPLDTLTLAGLYTLRVFAGNVATGLEPSFWLLAFSIFLFLSLAMAKRHAELIHLGARGGDVARGRGYLAADREMVSQLGVSAGYISVLVLALYLNSPQAALLYIHPGVLWLMCLLLLYWITRLWLIAHRGELDDDPVIFAIRDGQSRIVAIAACALLFLAR